MTLAQLIMFGIGALALAIGLALLLRSGVGSESQRYVRRIVGTMGAALGASLILFALGLAGKLEWRP